MPDNGCNLQDCFLCRNYIPEWKQLIGYEKKTVVFRKGKRVFSEGDPVRGIYFIYEGSAKVHINWGTQKNVIIRFAKSGDILGHRGFGSDSIYPVSATTLVDSKVCFIDNQLF